MDITEISGYRVLRQLGAGGMGQVFLVQHPRLPRQDALKLIDAGVSRNNEFKARFQREADLLALLSHPNIVTLYDRGEYDGRLWITMEYIAGTDADELLTTRGRLPIDLTQKLISCAGSALDYAWRKQQITHRDVKPANILLAIDDGQIEAVKLADFGIAKAAGESTTLTSTGMTVGTLQYVSPEAIEGHDVDNRSDVYSLGCTAFHLLTGQPPFAGKTMTSLISAHLNQDAPSISDVAPELPEALNPVFAMVLAKNPDDRYQSCGHFVAALAEATGSEIADPTCAQTMSAIPARIPKRTAYAPTMVGKAVATDRSGGTPPGSSRGAMAALWTSLAVIALAAIAAGFLLTRGGSESATPPPVSTTTPTTTSTSSLTPSTPTTAAETTTEVTMTQEQIVPGPVEGMPCDPSTDGQSPDATLHCSGMTGTWRDLTHQSNPTVQWNEPCFEPGARARVQNTDALVTCQLLPSGEGYTWRQ
ncbi:serine/threonine protein kinase PknB [Gordonia hirsuta DSM 44140 = NBRC 16056]|uniref:non-specific serine/threonine protein kinase n=1 Tax=Gordonia hirsuta DSM 44140 = NBRC 16056 TaxID=1121927 RepID=L7L4F3_9ACTN|nr:serine/threonine-protein kinase [Gordonia hirsuta]GAC56005.1 serine/threonine protein kinase PknB [Gordonia hirsuta DSM 44140 = NBRC 16056]